VAALAKNGIAEKIVASPDSMEKIRDVQRPFRNIFTNRPVFPVESAGRSVFAVPMPLLDSVSAASAPLLFVSVDGGSFLPLER
jgi:hypothetical protein